PTFGCTDFLAQLTACPYNDFLVQGHRALLLLLLLPAMCLESFELRFVWLDHFVVCLIFAAEGFSLGKVCAFTCSSFRFLRPVVRSAILISVVLTPMFFGQFSNNVVSFSCNVVLRDPLFSLNVVPKPRMLSV